MSGRFRKNLVWTCLAAGALALGAGCATNDAIEEDDFADDELIEEQEDVLDPGVGGAGDEGIDEEEDEAGVIAPSEGVDDGLFEQGEGEDESMFEPGVGGAGDEGDVLGDEERWDDDLEEPEDTVNPDLAE